MTAALVAAHAAQQDAPRSVLGAPAETPAQDGHDKVVVVINAAAGETFVKGDVSASPKLTAEEAWARYAEKNGAPATIPATVRYELGRFTLPPRIKNRSAYGFTSRSCPPSSLTTPPPSPCVEWTIIDANTGEALETTWQE